MPFSMESRFEALPLPSSVPGQSTTVLHLRWNCSRRVYSRTSAGTLLPTEDEPLGLPGSASVIFRCGSVSDLFPHIWYSLETLNFTSQTIELLCPKITDFASSTADRSPCAIIVARLKFIEKLYADSIDRPLAASGSLDEIFVLGTSTENWGGVEEDNKGASDSAIETLRRRKLERRGGEEESCSVCLETFSDGEHVIPLRCEHIYHESCIVTWLKKSKSCPICRCRDIVFIDFL